ncbi:sugar phosphate isomerase/epimerase family protein [Amycolatopsis sp. NPDC102389]|uniref:sugar phosphate isomerase/epimerase family protein n=1 Tax=Amycolatopsis sp. NPDC102389 TaxID=3363941 RepID=UPI003821D6BC
MIVPGLVSVTLRRHSVDEVAGLAAESGLRAIQWGGDVHVPVGDHAAARLAAARCSREGLEIEGYGSYYVAGGSDPGAFSDVVRTALALGAPRIRVWAGSAGSADVSPAVRTAIAGDLRRCADAAARHGLTVAVEYHPDTLTDTPASARLLTDQVDHEAFESYWQPGPGPDVRESHAEVVSLLPRLVGVHVFSWGPGGFTDRLALADHEPLWRKVFSELSTDGGRRHALLEFVQDDAPRNLHRDAATLLTWLGS